MHAQPYDDHELRQLLLPDGCPAPCFMGIRPGVTTQDEAIKILEASDWVETLTKNPLCVAGACPFQVYNVTWSKKASKWMDHETTSEIIFSNSNIVFGLDIVPNKELQVFDIYFMKLGSESVSHVSVGENSFADYLNCPAMHVLYPNSIGHMARQCPICLHSFSELLAAPVSDIFIGQAQYDDSPNNGVKSLRASINNQECRYP